MLYLKKYSIMNSPKSFIFNKKYITTIKLLKNVPNINETSDIIYKYVEKLNNALENDKK
jgi:hypothetical protein